MDEAERLDTARDIQLLRLLEEHGEQPVGELATMLGWSEEETPARFQRLREEGVIVSSRPIIDWERFGEPPVTAVIDIKLTPERDVGFDKVARRIARFPQVRAVHLMSGTYDLSVTVQGDNLREVAGFVSDRLAPLDGVMSTTTHFILKTYKEEGVLLEGNGEDPRLEVTP